MTQAVQKRAAAAIDSGSGTPADLLKIAVDKDADVEKLEKLMQLQERWERNQARKAYHAAMLKFQNIVPVIDRVDIVDFTTRSGRTQYRFASLGHIVKTLREPLQKCGLSYRFEMSEGPDGGVKVACVVTHVDGHSERTEMSAPADGSGSKNAIQARGSTVSYLERYSLLCALGVVTADADDDGRGAGAKEEPAPEQTDFSGAVEAWVRENYGPETPLFGWRCSAADADMLRGIVKAKGDKAAKASADHAIAWLRENYEVEVYDGIDGAPEVAFTPRGEA